MTICKTISLSRKTTFHEVSCICPVRQLHKSWRTFLCNDGLPSVIQSIFALEGFEFCWCLYVQLLQFSLLEDFTLSSLWLWSVRWKDDCWEFKSLQRCGWKFKSSGKWRRCLGETLLEVLKDYGAFETSVIIHLLTRSNVQEDLNTATQLLEQEVS
jgi:hypothetical protein